MLMGTAQMSGWFPPPAATGAAGVDGAFWGLYASAAFALVGVVGLAAAFVRIYRRRGSDQDPDRLGAPAGRLNPLLLGLWTAAAAGLAALALSLGLPGFLDQSEPPYGAYPIAVTARQGDFDFQYPNGHLADTLHVAVGRPVKLTMTSQDMIHGLSIPAFRLHQAILPGRQTQAWFEATLADTFGLRSDIYSGEGFAAMRTALVSHSPADFDAWLLRVSDIFAGRTLPEVGELLYSRQGCKTCHSLDGQRLVGPSFKDLYGSQFATREGTTVTADDQYIRESILYPNRSVIQGYDPVMTPYEGKLGDKEIQAIVAWLQTLSSKGATAAAAAEAGQ